MPENTRYSQETDIHAPGGIRPRHPNTRVALDPRLIPHDHWDQPLKILKHSISVNFEQQTTLLCTKWNEKKVGRGRGLFEVPIQTLISRDWGTPRMMSL